MDQLDFSMIIFLVVPLLFLLASYFLLLFFKQWSKSSISAEKIAKVLIANNNFHNGGFNEHLNMSESISNVQCMDGRMTFEYRIPNGICFKDKSMQLGGIMALADEMTTLLAMSHDQSHRPGVSIELSGTICGTFELNEGEKMFVEVLAKKLGATVGFTEMTMYKEVGMHFQKIAIVKHTKYLKMGFL